MSPVGSYVGLARVRRGVDIENRMQNISVLIGAYMSLRQNKPPSEQNRLEGRTAVQFLPKVT
jgi:hypothetical protein